MSIQDNKFEVYVDGNNSDYFKIKLYKKYLSRNENLNLCESIEMQILY